MSKTSNDQAEQTVETATTSAESQPAFDSFSFEATESDTNALQATQARTEVGLTKYEFGSMVESINGQAADSSHYWALYINNEYAQQAADQTKVAPGDAVLWLYEEIQTGE